MDQETYFSDYDAFTEHDISEITANGIALKNGRCIDFAVCAEVWAKVHSLKISTCIGECDITDLSFTFYTLPNPTEITFVEKTKCFELFSKRNAKRRFRDLQTQIIGHGYGTYDMA